MLLEQIIENTEGGEGQLDDQLNIDDLQKLYQNAKIRFDSDVTFRQRAHANVVKL